MKNNLTSTTAPLLSTMRKEIIQQAKIKARKDYLQGQFLSFDFVAQIAKDGKVFQYFAETYINELRRLTNDY